MALDSINDDFDELDARDAKVEAERQPKKTLIELPFVAARVKDIQLTRIDPSARVRSANAEYLFGEYIQEGYHLKEALRDSALIGKNGKEIPAHLSDEQAEKLKSPATKQREQALADWKEKGGNLRAENKKLSAILNDSHNFDRLKERSQGWGYRPNVIEHKLAEVDYDEDAYQDALIFIAKTPAKIQKLKTTASFRSVKEMKADIPAQLAKAKARWKKNFRLGNFTKRNPKGDHQIPPLTMDGGYIPGVRVMPISVDPLAHLAMTDEKTFVRLVEQAIDDFASTHDVAASENAQKQIGDLTQRLREAHITEEQQIRAAQRVGIMLPRRQDAKLGLVFDFQKK